MRYTNVRCNSFLNPNPRPVKRNTPRSIRSAISLSTVWSSAARSGASSEAGRARPAAARESSIRRARAERPRKCRSKARRIVWGGRQPESPAVDQPSATTSAVSGSCCQSRSSSSSRYGFPSANRTIRSVRRSGSGASAGASRPRMVRASRSRRGPSSCTSSQRQRASSDTVEMLPACPSPFLEEARNITGMLVACRCTRCKTWRLATSMCCTSSAASRNGCLSATASSMRPTASATRSGMESGCACGGAGMPG